MKADANTSDNLTLLEHISIHQFKQVLLITISNDSFKHWTLSVLVKWTYIP